MDAESVSKVVPEIYYDLISRLIPGLAFVLCLDTLRDLLFSWSTKCGQIITVIAFLLAGYLIGLMLSALAALFNLIFWSFLKPQWLCKWAGATLDLPSSPFKAFAKSYQLIDNLKKTDALAGAVLTKMEATAALSDNLLCGLIALMILRILGIESTILVHLKLTIGLFVCLLLVVVLRRGVLLARLSGFIIISKSNKTPVSPKTTTE
ncbi:MAG: hypothetical protein ABR969_10115 [Sedimentisphaerales bacterium]|jgi:hypothetical protein